MVSLFLKAISMMVCYCISISVSTQTIKSAETNLTALSFSTLLISSCFSTPYKTINSKKQRISIISTYSGAR